MVQVKSNLARMGSAILFEVNEGGVVFRDKLDMTAEELFSEKRSKPGRPTERVDSAGQLIQELLQDGPMKATEIEGILMAAGFRRSTIQKAKRNSGIASEKEGMIWYWSLPEEEDD